MRMRILAAVTGLALAFGLGGQAQAAGCLSGALLGGVAGHMAHHGVLGALGGCAVGHHMAASAKQKQADQEMQQQQMQQQPMQQQVPQNGTTYR